jgi:hypothetical protein
MGEITIRQPQVAGVSSRDIFMKTKLFFLKPCRGTVHVFCEHLLPSDEPACHPKSKSSRQGKEVLFAAAQRFGELPA